MQSKPLPNQVFLTAQQVQARYGGVSRTWLWRRKSDNPEFPKPVKINGRKFWKIEALEAYENTLTAE